jgi:hypothetical protein
MFYVVRGEALNKVLHYAKHSVRPLQPNELFWVYPYFKDRRTVGLLEIENASRKLVRTVRLNPARYLYFGLHSEFADSEQTRVLATRQETLEAYGYALKMSRFRIGFLHVRCDLKAEFNPPRKRAIFLVTETAGFDEVASMRHAFERLDIADGADRFAETLKPVPWSDYALAQITEIIERDGGYSARVSTMVRSLQGDPPVFTALLRYLESHNQRAILEQIRKLIADKPLFSIRGVDIIEMANGYAARKAGQNTPVQFTNFRIRIDCIIWFEQSQQTYLSGRLLLNNRHQKGRPQPTSRRATRCRKGHRVSSKPGNRPAESS